MNQQAAGSGASAELPVSLAYLVPKAPFVGAVHSVFATACNLRVREMLIVVHDAAKPHTPTSVRVASGGVDPWSPSARAGDPVTLRAGRLSFGGHVLALRQLPVWSPAPFRASPQALSAHRRSMQLAVLAQACHARSASRTDPRLVDGVHILRTQIAAVIRAETGSGPPPASCGIDEAVSRLIGLGVGLTPAGDDMLVGLLAVLHRHRDTPGTSRALTVVKDAVGRRLHCTTDISAHYLRLAAQDHVGEAFHRLLDAVDADAPTMELAARAAEAVALGATSGADTVRGVVAGLTALLHLPHDQHLQESAA